MFLLIWRIGAISLINMKHSSLWYHKEIINNNKWNREDKMSDSHA